MERMWRKVNHSFGGRSAKSTVTTIQSTDTVSSAGGFGDGQHVTAIATMAAPSGNTASNMPSSTATGRRLAASGQVSHSKVSTGQHYAEESNTTTLYHKSLSQHVLQNRTASSERRRRRRRKSRPRRSGVSCVGGGGGGDNMSSSGGFYTIKESSGGNGSHYRHHRQSHSSTNRKMANSAPTGTVMMYPNTYREIATITPETVTMQTTISTTSAAATPDISLRQRAVAKLRMFNFHLNWDLHMTHCKPCGPRLGGTGGGNIIMRRLCRNRRHEDNELYRSNSFKFERFERKECIEELSDTLQKQIAICDDYSLPVDFVKKRPSSFDPSLSEVVQTNTGNWTPPSPQAEIIAFTEPKHQYQNQQTNPKESTLPPPPPPPPAPLSTLPTHSTTCSNSGAVALNSTLPVHKLSNSQHVSNPQSIPHKSYSHRNHTQTSSQPQPSSHPPLPNTIKQAAIKLIEGYSDPKDSKRERKINHKKNKRRVKRKQQLNYQVQTPNLRKDQGKKSKSNCSSDSSAPKSSDDEENYSLKVPELNSPDSITEDLVHPLPSQLYNSPKKLTVCPSETSKRNPSPYYYSDLLKSKDSEHFNTESINIKSRQSTVSEPPKLSQSTIQIEQYRKSTSLDVPEQKEHNSEHVDSFDDLANAAATDTPKRYSFTEEGVHIIRCDSPSTSTSDESDCAECQKRRQWHARALALVRKTCNVQPLNTNVNNSSKISESSSFVGDTLSMPPHRLLGPAVCACVAPVIGDDVDELFRPRSIFYVHPHGVHECADCQPEASNLNTSTQNAFDLRSSIQLNNTRVEGVSDEMSGRTREIYETAFDCKITKSDDDLDEVDRITNHAVLLQSGNSGPLPKNDTRSPKSSSANQRFEGKRLKNSKNHAIQEQSSNSERNDGSASSHSTAPNDNDTITNADLPSNIANLATEIDKIHIRGQTTEQPQQQQNAATSSSQLPVRGYTPSPPSTAPLPIKFPGKHDRFFMNSIKSAPNLPSSNPAHPRLRDLRLPIQSALQKPHTPSIGTSNENSLADSAYVNPPSSSHHTHHNSIALNSRTRNRPRSFIIESGRVAELRKSHASHHHHVSNGGRKTHNYSSTESIATSSSGGSMESLRSSTSEGNRSTSSSESRNSTSLSSHSSESGSSSVAFPLRAPIVVHSKLHILSPISDKSSQEPGSELSEQNKSQHISPNETTTQRTHQTQFQKNSQIASNVENLRPLQPTQNDLLKKKKLPTNKTLLQLTDEIIGSDSGISLHSREDSKLVIGLQKYALPKLNCPQQEKNLNENSNITNVAEGVDNGAGVAVSQDLRDLPFDMPKLRRKKTLQQEACTSGSATSVDLGDLPFDMPKLRRRLRVNQTEVNNFHLSHSTGSSGISQASSSHSMRDENKMKLDGALFRHNLTLNLNEPRQTNKFGSLDLRGLSTNKELNLNFGHGFTSAVDLIDVSIPLERQGWYHGAITRIEAESTLRPLNEGSFLVRNCESTKQDYSLSLKGAKGFMHMRIQRNEAGQYILGQFSRPFDTVPEMIRHFCLNRLPVRGAEHMCLIQPVIVQLL